MDRIQSYIDRFFKIKEMNKHYSLTTDDVIAFIEEIQGTGINGIFYVIRTLFNYGYIKGYRARMAEKKKSRKQ